MRIEFSTNDYHDALRLMNETPPDGVKLDVKMPFVSKSEDAKNIAEFILEFGEKVSIALLVKWLIVKLKDSTSKKITIDRKEVTFEEGEITRVIEETTRIEE